MMVTSATLPLKIVIFFTAYVIELSNSCRVAERTIHFAVRMIPELNKIQEM